MNKLFITVAMFFSLVDPAIAQDSDEVLIDWTLNLKQIVMKYEKPRCIKFFWVPGGCPESSEALKFKAQCELDSKATQKTFYVDVVSNLTPKLNWYEKHIKHLHFKTQKLKSNSEGEVDITNHLNKFSGLRGYFEVKNGNQLVPALDSKKKVNYFTEFDGRAMSLIQKFGDEESELFKTEDLQTIVIRKSVCKNSPSIKRYLKGKNDIEFAYIMTAISAAPQK